MTASISASGRAVVDSRVLWDVTFLFSVIAGVFVVVFRDDLLPRRFFYDGEHIQQIAQGFNSGLGDQSYVQVAMVYRLLGMADHALAASLFGFGLGVLSLLIFRASNQDKPSWQAVVLTPIAVLTMAVYLGFYSKDVFLVPIAAVAIAASQKRRVEFAFMAMILMYALFFRSYWALVALAYLPLRLAVSRRYRAQTVALVMSGMLVAFSLVIFFVLGLDPDHYRSMVNDARLTSADAASAIRPLVPGDGLGVGVANVLVMIPLLTIPVPLLLSGSGYHAALFLAISVLWVLFYSGTRKKHLLPIRTAADRSSGEPASRESRAVAVVLAILTVQALFEPDYGSALRHITPFLIVWVALHWQRSDEGRQTARDGLF